MQCDFCGCKLTGDPADFREDVHGADYYICGKNACKERLEEIRDSLDY